MLAARWLVLMHHNRYPEALAILETFPKAKPSEDLHLAALRAAAWIHTAKQAYPQALIQAEQIAQAATPNPPATDSAILEAQNEAITFLGKPRAFWRGLAEKAADKGREQSSKKRPYNDSTSREKKPLRMPKQIRSLNLTNVRLNSPMPNRIRKKKPKKNGRKSWLTFRLSSKSSLRK